MCDRRRVDEPSRGEQTRGGGGMPSDRTVADATLHVGRGGSMGIAASLIVIAVGAVLRFAVSVTTTGFNLQSIGLILMIVGAASLLLSVVFWSSWGGFGGNTVQRRQRRITRDGAGGFIEEERTDGSI
jgi:hypothetical protein